MKSAATPTFARLGLALIACASLMVTAGRTQDSGPTKLQLPDAALAGIDRGLRDQGPPLEPGGVSAQMLAAMERADGLRPHTGYVPGSLIVKFRPGTETAAKAAAVQPFAGTTREQPSSANFDIVTIPESADAERVAAELSARPEVEFAQPRYVARPMQFRPNDPLYTQQWNFPALDMERAWAIQQGASPDIIVAVLDTGVAFENRVVQFNARAWRLVDANGQTIVAFPALGLINVPFAFAPELGGTRFAAPRDFIWDDNAPYDFEGHGTHVSGTVGQLTNNGLGVAGMAFNVRIMPVKVLGDIWDFIFGNPTAGTDDLVARGIRYAADNGAKVINMSLGRTGGGPAPVIDDALRYAVSRGVFVAIAAGNSADTDNAPNRYGDSAPAIPGVMVVGSVGRDLDRAFYSTFNSSVEIAAPGGDQRRNGRTGGVLQQTLDPDLLHTYTGGPATYRAPRMDAFVYEFFQGTSMASPHVAGFAALLMQQGITSPAAVEAAMKQYARDLGSSGADPEYGAGLIQPRTTLRGLGLAR
jgi:serine protease